jgi:hypothetical protein
MIDDPFSIIILPFLKTSGAVLFGGIQFRSTDDAAGLPAGQAAAVDEVTRMLFAQDEMRIKVASYAIIPFMDLDRAQPTTHLENIQAVIAYLYSSPHQVFGSPFLSSEHASLVLFTPSDVSIYLLRSSYNVVVDRGSSPEPDERQNVRGYAALYNFRHHFWVAKDSRVYGPLPHPVLNIAQDLHRDVTQASEQFSYRLLFRLLEKPHTPVATRVLTALRWYNSAHREATDEFAAIVHLAIAFEALLGLPQTEKTDRLVDAIALLLGRVPRLDAWAEQFYHARSRIVHQGHTDNLRFVTAAESRKVDAQMYQSFLAYGTQIFRLCLGTLLVGADLADQSGLEERLVTNQERYERLCRLFADQALRPLERLEKAAELVDAIDRYRFVGETGLRLETMIGAVRWSAKTLLESREHLEESVTLALIAVAQVGRSPDHFDELDAIRNLDETLPDTQRPTGRAEDTIRRLVKAVWGSVFMHYFWIKDCRRPIVAVDVATTQAAAPNLADDPSARVKPSAKGDAEQAGR